MRVLIITVGVVIVIWILSLLIQHFDKRRREQDIQKRLDQKKKDKAEEDNRPFRR